MHIMIMMMKGPATEMRMTKDEMKDILEASMMSVVVPGMEHPTLRQGAGTRYYLQRLFLGDSSGR